MMHASWGKVLAALLGCVMARFPRFAMLMFCLPEG